MFKHPILSLAIFAGAIMAAALSSSYLILVVVLAAGCILAVGRHTPL